jgi:hypothetical protein
MVFVGAQKNYEKCAQKVKRTGKKEERKERFQSILPLKFLVSYKQTLQQ